MQEILTSAAREVNGPIYTVTATAYQAVAGQTDDEPFVTADNSFIEADYSSKLRWLAISQDLLAHWGGKIRYGDQVWVRGVSPGLDGLYTVHDTMNKRHKHCIDILSNPGEKFDIFVANVKLQRTVPTARPKLRAKQTARPPATVGSRAGRNKQVAGGQARRLVQPA
ncbi:MAG: hypothetical protein EOO57_07400, partial [Hymenobacter sp.]